MRLTHLISVLVVHLLIGHSLQAQLCALDVFVANDQSGSVSAIENTQSRQFISSLFQGMQPWGTGPGESRMAIADWDSPNVWQQFSFPSVGASYTTEMSDVLAYQNAQRALLGGTDPVTALTRSYQQIGQAPIAGRVARPVIVLMTDAACSQVPAGLTALATQIKNAGVYIVVVAIEAASSCPSLAGANVASPGGYFSAPTYAQLVQANVQLVQDMINAGCTGSVDPSYDLTIAIDAFTASGCNTGSPTFTADFTVTNAGPVDFNGALVVSFYDGPPSAATTNLLLVQNFGVQSIPATATYSGSVSSLQFAATTILYAVVNFDGAAVGNAPPIPFNLAGETVVADEYSTFNNTSAPADRVSDPVTCPPQAIITTAIVSGGTGCEDLVPYEITICNTGDASAFITPTLPIAAPGAILVNNVIQPGEFTVDLDWATYTGGDDEDEAFSVATDAAGNVYIAGTTRSTNGIGTPGAYQPAYTDGRDAFLVKFNSNGVRLWGTYYGSDDDDYGMGVATDPAGNVYLVGYTDSPTNIATAGAHQVALNAAEDAFIVKFNAAGVRQWASYYGGADADFGFSVAADAANNVYLAGVTEGSTTLGTVGAFDNTFNGTSDQFLVKFNAAGVRQWATYYGGALAELEANVATDAAGNVLLTGQTTSLAGIATAGAAQVVLGGLEDVYVVKFNAAGARQWASYYGGLDSEETVSVACDLTGNAYLTGTTGSDNGIAFSAAHQGFRAGGRDGFLVKFNPAGVRQWGNYLGGTSGERGRDVATDAAGDVYVTGSTDSPDLIATLFAYRTVLNGIDEDAYLMKFNPQGQRVWGTYYGGDLPEESYSLALDAQGSIYITGATESLTDIATAGAHQTALDADVDAFLAKFFEVELPYLLNGGECVVRQYLYDYSAVAAGTYNLSLGITADIVNAGDEPPLVLPDIGFDAGAFLNIDGFNGAVHTTDDAVIPISGTICPPGDQITIAVNIPTVNSCGNGNYAQATVTITNNSGLTVSNTELHLNLSGTGATYVGEIYNATSGLTIAAPNLLDPNYPFVAFAVNGQSGNQFLPITSIPPGVSTFNIDLNIGSTLTNLFAQIDSVHTGLNATGQSNVASDATGVGALTVPVISGFNCPGSIAVGANLVLNGISVTGATSVQWASTTVASIPGGGTLASPTLTYAPTPLDVANGFVAISLTALSASGCDATVSCQIDITNVQYDYGDAPVVYDMNINYQPPAAASTLFSGLVLGVTGPSTENIAHNSVLADGDGNEEDALLSNPYTAPWPGLGGVFDLLVRATNTTTSNSFLHAFVDWNADGDFLDSLESSTNTVVKAPLSGTQFHNMHFVVPPFANTSGLFYIRLRLSVDSMSVTFPYMAAPRGETEDYVWESIGILPVELVAFTGHDMGATVRLEWTTASERNSGHFVVERARDALDYSPIGTLPAAGYSQSLLEYTFIDQAPLSGLSYYRLLQVDLDGTEAYHGPVAIEHSGAAAVRAEVLPGQGVVIHGPGWEQVVIHDHSGRRLAEGMMTDGQWRSTNTVSGVYLAVLRSGARVETLRFVVP